MSQAGALALLAAALLTWPSGLGAFRLARAAGSVQPLASENAAAYDRPGRGLPGWLRSRSARGLLGLGGLGALAQFWPWPVAVVVVAVAAAAGRALVRVRRERGLVGEEQAAIEGLGVLVAELRAGRPADEALSAAGRHCGHPAVGSWIGQLGRGLRLGDRMDGRFVDVRAPPAAGSVKGAVVADWQSSLLAGLALSQQSGCALSDVITAVEADLAGRCRQRGELRAAASGQRATAGLLAGLPVLGLLMGSGIGAEPVRILTATPIGHILLMSGVGLELAGLAWSAGMTRRAMRGR